MKQLSLLFFFLIASTAYSQTFRVSEGISNRDFTHFNLLEKIGNHYFVCVNDEKSVQIIEYNESLNLVKKHQLPNADKTKMSLEEVFIQDSVFHFLIKQSNKNKFFTLHRLDYRNNKHSIDTLIPLLSDQSTLASKIINNRYLFSYILDANYLEYVIYDIESNQWTGETRKIAISNFSKVKNIIGFGNQFFVSLIQETPINDLTAIINHQLISIDIAGNYQNHIYALPEEVDKRDVEIFQIDSTIAIINSYNFNKNLVLDIQILSPLLKVIDSKSFKVEETLSKELLRQKGVKNLIRNITTTQDGDWIVQLEEFDKEEVVNTVVRYYTMDFPVYETVREYFSRYNNIFILRVDLATQKIVNAQSLLKNQYSEENAIAGSSYQQLLTPKGIYFLYNDFLPDGRELSVHRYDGKQLNVKAIDFSSLNGLMLFPRYAKQLSNQSTIIPAFKGDNFQLIEFIVLPQKNNP